MKHPITCGILAGGASSRMGQNKALLSFRGRPLMLHLLAKLRPLFDPLLIGANDPSPYVAYGVPIVPDVLTERCALTGIHAILTAARTEYVFVVACDMPFLNPALIERMVSRRIGHDVVVPESNRGIEPLHSLYSRTCIDPIEETVREGSWKVTDFYRRVRVDPWRVRDEQWTVDGQSPFFNLNTPDDLRRAAP